MNDKHHLQEARETLGLSRVELAERIGVKARTLKSWELATRQPGPCKYLTWVNAIEASELLDELNHHLRSLLERDDERSQNAMELLRLVASQRSDALGYPYTLPALARPVFDRECMGCKRLKVSEDFITKRGSFSKLCSACRSAVYRPVTAKRSAAPVGPTPPVADPYGGRSSDVRLRTA